MTRCRKRGNGMLPTPQRIGAFRRVVYRYFSEHGRSFPWRETEDPYRIAVSELMLQQTQTGRVVEFYERFLTAFPTVHALASAPLASVLAQWQGLGYNRRAVYLRKMAITVVELHHGEFPRTIEGLRSLPGVGPYTAGAIAAFAFNLPSPIIETNIRAAFIHYFYPHQRSVRDEDLRVLIEATLDRANPRRWYSALMDYGSYCKRENRALTRRSAHYRRQSSFAGSLRQARGAIVRALLKEPLSEGELASKIGTPQSTVRCALEGLLAEGMIALKRQKFCVPEQ